MYTSCVDVPIRPLIFASFLIILFAKHRTGNSAIFWPGKRVQRNAHLTKLEINATLTPKLVYDLPLIYGWTYQRASRHGNVGRTFAGKQLLMGGG